MSDEQTAEAQESPTAPGIGNGTLRQRLRDKVLGQALHSKIIELDGDEILVVAPTLEVRDEWTKRLNLGPAPTHAPVVDSDGKETPCQCGECTPKILGSRAKANVWLVMNCSYEPGTDPVRMFNGNDEKELLGLPANGFVDTIANAAMALMNTAREEAVKNSEATPT